MEFMNDSYLELFWVEEAKFLGLFETNSSRLKVAPYPHYQPRTIGSIVADETVEKEKRNKPETITEFFSLKVPRRHTSYDTQIIEPQHWRMTLLSLKGEGRRSPEYQEISGNRQFAYENGIWRLVMQSA